MGTKNNLLIVLLVVLIGIISGVGILIGINNAVGNALMPLKGVLMAFAKVENRNSVALAQIQKELRQINAGGTAQQPQQEAPEDMNKIYTIDPGVAGIIGKKDAPVTIVEFSDFQCPFCARFYPVVKSALAAYPDQVRLIIKNFPLPFHPNARPAAKLAMAANEQGKFQGMMEALLTNGGDVSDAKVKEYAQSLGLDYKKLMADYKDKDAQWEKQVQDDLQLGEKVDVRGTPTFYLNGRKTNARDIKEFKTEIDAILAGKK